MKYEKAKVNGLCNSSGYKDSHCDIHNNDDIINNNLHNNNANSTQA